MGFFSKKLSKSEVNYSTFNQELLAAIAAPSSCGRTTNL
ncbi:MAG: hypothetical protein ACK55Z_26635 [bacterium]